MFLAGSSGGWPSIRGVARGSVAARHRRLTRGVGLCTLVVGTPGRRGAHHRRRTGARNRSARADDQRARPRAPRAPSRASCRRGRAALPASRATPSCARAPTRGVAARQRRITRRRKRAVRRVALQEPLILVDALRSAATSASSPPHQLARGSPPSNATSSASSTRTNARFRAPGRNPPDHADHT